MHQTQTGFGKIKLQQLRYRLMQSTVQGEPAWIVSDPDDQELEEFQKLLVGKWWFY